MRRPALVILSLIFWAYNIHEATSYSVLELDLEDFEPEARGSEVEVDYNLLDAGFFMRIASNASAAETLNLPANATSIRANITDTFSCENRTYGYYADVDNDCQVFHVCQTVTPSGQKSATYRWSFICPEGTVFNQEVFVCTRPEDSINCTDSPDYYSLNDDIGKTSNDSQRDVETYSINRENYIIEEPGTNGLKEKGSTKESLVIEDNDKLQSNEIIDITSKIEPSFSKNNITSKQKDIADEVSTNKNTKSNEEGHEPENNVKNPLTKSNKESYDVLIDSGNKSTVSEKTNFGNEEVATHKVNTELRGRKGKKYPIRGKVKFNKEIMS